MTKQVYLVIYEGQNGRQANFIAGKEYFTEKAEAHPQFDGLEAGIIVRTKAGLEYRQGTFWMHEEEKLLGGWAIVHRKDRKIPLKMEVPLADYDTKKNLWAKMPATMIRKVALVQALREAFPQNLGGMYDQAEIVDAEIMEAEA
jgi:phage recombination protein Bet